MVFVLYTHTPFIRGLRPMTGSVGPPNILSNHLSDVNHDIIKCHV